MANMKFALFCLAVMTAILNLSCGQNAASAPSSPSAPAEIFEEIPSPVPTPSKYEEIDIIEQISMGGKDNPPASITVDNYKIRKETVRKKDDADSPVTDISDAVLSKNGKTIARFEGIYYPLGNSMSFGLFSFLGTSEKQLLIVDETNRYDREWIISLSPKYEVLFDAADYHVQGGYMRLIDIDKDGVYELFYGVYIPLSFMFSRSSTPLQMVVFKFDAKTRRYLPATHIFTDYTLAGIDEKVQSFNNNRVNSLSALLKIFITYVYAGKEEEAWKFFDHEGLNFSTQETFSGKVEGKEQIIKHIKNALDDDPIYRFIRRDLKRK